MRILMASHAYPPAVSGVTVVVQKLARAMVQRGHEVTVVAGTDRDEAYRDDDQGVRLIRVRGVSNPWWKETVIPFISRKDLDEIAEEARPDILHAHETALLALQFLRLKHDAGLPGLVTSYYVPRFAARYLSWGDTPLSSLESVLWNVAVWAHNQADHAVFATIAHRDLFSEQGLYVPNSIISNGIDVSRYFPNAQPREDTESKYNLPPRPRILFVSRLAKDKEIATLIEAMPYVCAARQANLLLVGRGEERRHLEELADELGVGKHVYFLGFVPEEDMPEIYRASDLFAIASLCEVQSLPTLQALACALPVVAADAVALPEIVHQGVNGFLVPPNDPKAMAESILRLVEDPELCRQMGQAGVEIAQAHDENRTFDLYEELYGRMIAKSV